MNIIQDVIDLDVFDESGKLVTQIKSMDKGTLFHNAHESTLTVRDVLFNLEMLKLIGEDVEKELKSDFDSALSEGDETIIRFNRKQESKKLKLIGRGVIYATDTANISHDFQVIMPSASLIAGHKFEFDTDEVQRPTYRFHLLPFNEDGDLFEIRLTERK